MPVDLNFANSIIEAFSRGHQEKQDIINKANQLKLQRDQLEQQKQLEEEKLKQEHEHQTAQMDLMQQAHELAKLAQKQELAAKYAQGFGDQGSQVTQSNTPTAPPPQAETDQGYNPVIPQQAPIARSLPGDSQIPEGHVELNHPLLGRMIVPTPETYNKTLGEREAAIEGPKQEAETKRQVAVKMIEAKAAAEKIAEEIASREKIAQAEIAGRHQDNAATNATRLKVADITHSDTATTKAREDAKNLATKFDSTDIKKRYDIVKEATDFANGLDLDTKNPGDDMALIDAFAKVMNPNSIIRQTNADWIQKNITDLADRLGFAVARVSNLTPFLTRDARKALKDTINSRAGAVNNLYGAAKDEVYKRIKTMGANPDEFFIDGKPAKTVTKAQVQQFATENKVPYDKAKEHFEKSNFIVQ